MIMALHDDSLLTAYLDGELDSAQRLMVQAALLDSPELAERLQSLASVRSLLGAMARPTLEADLSGPIDRELGARAQRRHLRVRVASLAAAAVLMLAVVPLFRDWPDRPEPRRIPDRSVAVVHQPPPTIRARTDVPRRDTEPPAPAVPTALAAGPPPSRPGPPAEPDLDRLRALLLQGEAEPARRVVVVIDSLNPDLLAQVRGAVLETVRQDSLWGEIPVGANLVDPSLHDEAFVFAMRMDDSEYAHFEQHLRRRIPGSVAHLENESPDPLVTERLAALTPSLVAHVPAASRLTSPPPDLGATARHASLEPSLSPGEGTPGRLPIPSAVDLTAPPAPAPTAPADTHGPQRLYLVWVTANRATR